MVNLIVGREIAELALPGMPHLGSGISWMRDGRRVMATPHLKEGILSIIDVEDLETRLDDQDRGPGVLPAASHENSPYVWADAFFGKDKNAMHIIDKQSLEIVTTLRPRPGATVAHVEFDRTWPLCPGLGVGRSMAPLIVYDAKTLRGDQAHSHDEAFGQVQCLQQDHVFRRDEPLTTWSYWSAPWAPSTAAATVQRLIVSITACMRCSSLKLRSGSFAPWR